MQFPLGNNPTFISFNFLPQDDSWNHLHLPSPTLVWFVAAPNTLNGVPQEKWLERWGSHLPLIHSGLETLIEILAVNRWLRGLSER